MDTRAVKAFVNDNPDGVVIRMVDGTTYRVPHRDYIWFTPAFGEPESRVGRLGTAFWLHDIDRQDTKLVNSLLIKSIEKLKRNGHAKKARRRKAG